MKERHILRIHRIIKKVIKHTWNDTTIMIGDVFIKVSAWGESTKTAHCNVTNLNTDKTSAMSYSRDDNKLYVYHQLMNTILEVL